MFDLQHFPRSIGVKMTAMELFRQPLGWAILQSPQACRHAGVCKQCQQHVSIFGFGLNNVLQ
jgi:hypothetical protein